tara:strand:- start:78 stop:326 length:249 start_codon:yes stop_codon:yes gene_type:complete
LNANLVTEAITSMDNRIMPLLGGNDFNQGTEKIPFSIDWSPPGGGPPSHPGGGGPIPGPHVSPWPEQSGSSPSPSSDGNSPP